MTCPITRTGIVDNWRVPDHKMIIFRGGVAKNNPLASIPTHFEV